MKTNNYGMLGKLGKMESTDSVLMAVEIYKKLLKLAEQEDEKSITLIYGIVSSMETSN